MAKWQRLFPGRFDGPGLKSPFKLWWAKEITPDIHTAGRLTNRQIKYAEDGGFRSILSLFTYNSEGLCGNDILHKTSDVKKMLVKTSSLTFAAVLDSEKNWMSEKAIDRFGTVIPEVAKPALFFSTTGLECTFVLLMHFAKETRKNPKFEPNMNSERFYKIAAAMGYDFTSDEMKKRVSQITGEPVVESPPKPNAEPASWLDYWHAHPVYRNWFTAGQISKPQFPAIVSAGFRAVVNLRPGLTFEGKPHQEEVTLLNITENTGTYGKEGVSKLRQSQERLESTRIDPKKSNEYISKDSTINYESRNEDEFGDDVGYNRDLETEYFKKNYPELEYATFPIDAAAPFTKEVYYKYRDKMLEVGNKGPVLVHCIKARRACFMSILAAAEQHNKDLEWALNRSEELGYGVTKETNPTAYDAFVSVLGK